MPTAIGLSGLALWPVLPLSRLSLPWLALVLSLLSLLPCSGLAAQWALCGPACERLPNPPGERFHLVAKLFDVVKSLLGALLIVVHGLLGLAQLIAELLQARLLQRVRVPSEFGSMPRRIHSALLRMRFSRSDCSA